jgi:serine phosphatase RsbU (regulator of sigma subunit)
MLAHKNQIDSKIINKKCVNLILENEVSFLKGMHIIVGQYEKEAQQKIQNLKNIELTLMLITLIALLLEAFFIFRPAVNQLSSYVRQIQEYVEELRASDEEIRQNLEEITTINENLEKSKYELNTLYKNVMASINYAKRIQEAMLPPIQNIQNVFDEAFVIYKPKDVVSGDFYWFSKVENRTFLACADCTGHGVPGALMSMIGIELLNRIVNEQRIYRPDLVLDELNTQIHHLFSQSQTSTTDGMDIALCVVDHTNHKIYFAGARRSLWIWQKDENGNINNIEIKADRKAIGGYLDYQYFTKKFQQYELTIQNPTNLYMFSDGITDQFNGNTGKKLGTQRFKSHLQEIQSLNMIEQSKAIENFHNEWKGNSNQIDDILVIGIKV